MKIDQADSMFMQASLSSDVLNDQVVESSDLSNIYLENFSSIAKSLVAHSSES